MGGRLMSIKINSMLDTTNNSWEVSLGGELDVSTADELKKELHKLVDEKNIDMRLNLENLDYIDSTGLGVIIGILKRLKIESKEVYIEKPKNNVRKIFSITGLDKIFKLEG
jgi:anti-sigma B factor antagonist